MFDVFENGKRCTPENFDVHSSWDHDPFDNLSNARNFVMKWMGQWRPSNKEDFVVGYAYDYTGYGDTIEIRKVSE